MTDREASREKFEAWALSELKQDATRWRNHEGYVYLQSEWLAWQASRQQALEEIALPKSYGGGSLCSWGPWRPGCTVNLGFVDADQAEEWFDRLTAQWDERRSLTTTGDKA